MVYTDAGKNGECTSGSGSNATGLSGFVISGTSMAADASDNLLVLGLWDDPVNLVGDQYALWMVLVNIGWFAPGGYSAVTGTLGV
jgi:hypothetical protein